MTEKMSEIHVSEFTSVRVLQPVSFTNVTQIRRENLEDTLPESYRNGLPESDKERSTKSLLEGGLNIKIKEIQETKQKQYL